MSPLEPYIADEDFTLYRGDVLEVLADLPDESVHCCVTSPPYWGLRDYGTGLWDGGDDGCDHLGAPFRTKSKLNEDWGAGFSDVKNTEDREPMGQTCSKCGARRVDQQLGLEPTPDEYVANMVAVFREVRRVLRRDGTCWLNIGDSYNAYNGNRGLSGTTLEGTDRPESRPRLPSGHGLSAGGLKPKDLVGIPWRLAFALQADGWYLRSDIIWSKPNPMPESVTDRPTKAHEYLFLLTRSPRYYFDNDAIREDYTPDDRKKRVHDHRVDGSHGNHAAMSNGNERWAHTGRNKRSVWEIATEPYPDAHFATFPQALVEPCILAGTSERGCCPVCKAPWERETTTEYDAKGRTTNGPRSLAQRHETAGFGQRLEKRVETTGWTSGCSCAIPYPSADGGPYPSLPPSPIPCTVLDPFMGSGTTALVARRHGRRSIGVELNPDYCALTARRLQQLSLLAA